MTLWVTFIGAVSGHFRRHRSGLYREHCADLRSLRVCDLGGSRHFWETMPSDLVPADLTLLNIEDDGQSRSHSGRLEHLKVQLYDGDTIPFPDGHFDVLICNSVIEHVPVARRLRLCGEIRRVARYHFVQTPAYAFPIEPHFVFPAIHWLPRAVGRRLVPLGLWAILNRPSQAKMQAYFDDVQLLTETEVKQLLPGSTIAKERVLGLVKSYTAHGDGTAASKT